MRRKLSSDRWGFTLVELLVAVGVIAILLAILLPMLNRARATARLVQCTNNMKQIDTAVHAWALKYNSMRLPQSSTWTTTVRAIVTDPATADKILACPDAVPSVAIKTTTIPSPDTSLEPGVEFEKNNKPHSVTFTQVDANTWLADEVYHKNWPNHATFKFTRVGNTNDWYCWPLTMDPKKTSVGPPLTIISVIDNVTYNNVQIGQSYLIKGSAISPITTTTQLTASSYGYNNFMSGAYVPKAGRIVVMDYPKTDVDFDGTGAGDDLPGNYLIGRHYKDKHNCLFSDGSVRILSVKELDPTKYVGSLYDAK